MGVVARLRSYQGLFEQRVWLLTYGQVLQSLGRGILLPFATLYFYNVQGFPLALVGLALAIAFPLGAIVGLAWGALADRYGRKPLMLLGFGGHAVTTAALAFVDTVPQYFLVVIASSITVAAWAPAARAMVADVTPPHRRTRAYGLTYMAHNFGLSFGILLGGALAIFLPYRALFFAEAAGSAAYFFVVLFFVHETFRAARRDAAAAPAAPLARVAAHLRDLATPLRDRAFLVLGLASLLAGLGYAQFYTAFSPWLKNVIGASDAWIAIVFAVNTVLVILLQIPIANWAERRRRTYMFIIAAYYMATSLLATWAAGRVGGIGPALALMIIACVLLTIQEIALAPVFPALLASMAGAPDRVAKYMAGLELIWAVNSGLGAVIGGLFFDAGRPQLLWPVMMGCALLSLPCYLWLAKLLPADVNQPAHEEPAPPPDLVVATAPTDG